MRFFKNLKVKELLVGSMALAVIEMVVPSVASAIVSVGNSIKKMVGGK